jgi:quercetin dioxygenase-like cupin family protein
MKLPAFIDALPALDTPIPESKVSTRAVQSDRGLVAFFTFHEDFELPPHSHKAQWGMVIAGEAVFTIGGKTTRFGPGECYNIPSGVEHSGSFAKGTVCVDAWEEPDRYALRG